MKEEDRVTAEGILFTDEYQMTMAHLYYRMGIHEMHAQFDHFFRSCPNYGAHQAGYCVNAGLEWLLDWMQDARFRERDIQYLQGRKSRTGKQTFGDDFLNWLSDNGNFSGISMQAIPEGRVVHPNVPVTVVQGPLAMAQILESPLLNQINYSILVATKAARISYAGHGRVVIEFGMRRAHEKGANAGARAALIGGADFTSNAGLSHVLGLEPKGTHAHSMVQAFMALGEGELGAFRAYADVYPDDCILLVDTVNTLESGIPNAIKVFEELRRKGHKPVGVRLDSGDLAYLSIRASKMLDDAGFPDTSIVLSNKLDELVIMQIIEQIRQEAPRYGVDPDRLVSRFVYGVGTRLITSRGDSALDGVYKLVSINKGGDWIPAIKISETVKKVLNPGHKHLWRIYDKRNMAVADLLTTGAEDPRTGDRLSLHHPTDETKFRTLNKEEISGIEPLLVDILKDGKLVYGLPSIEEMRKARMRDLERLDVGVKRLVNPHTYHVSLSDGLWELKQEMIRKAKESVDH
ncbi:MAG TPA: nicotinate phosphoribosyltransferase [Dissulfurispiraceae bacterium]|nr:nicotinate phosphoribosyltransferase [Dissulfurispiraceae bacterium]